jgi:NAD+ synthetase
LSGGIDSALTLCVAVDALGADKVRAVMMPSPYTAEISLADSREMVRRWACATTKSHRAGDETFAAMLEKEFAGLPADTTEENLQARIRGMILMALSNKTGSLVLTTGNKSEMAVGYCTLYGDMAGGFAVIKDIAKTLVYRLSRWRNTVSDVIPERIITRPPSAELKPGQTDQDSLPPYEVLDAIVEATWSRISARARSSPRAMPKPTCAASCACSRSANTSAVRRRSASASPSADSARTGVIRSPIATATPFESVTIPAVFTCILQDSGAMQ